MKLLRPELNLIIGLATVISLSISPAAALDKLPADSVGQINPLAGSIAFVRDGNIWVMDANGTNQRLVCRVANAEGRLCWSPDNRRIVFTRTGVVDLKGPDLKGGRHKVYDLFVCFLDSAEAGNTKHWERLTRNLGARGPEWISDGSRILFWRDMNANYINSRVANYQLCQVDPATGDVQALRRDWQADHEQFLVTPSMNRRREVAFVFFNEQQPGGLVVLPLKDISVSLDSIQQIAERNRGCVAPAWSPDDRWLAAVGNYPDDSGLFIATADLKQMYLVTLPPDGTQINKYTPSFSSDSDWITFSTSDGSVWVCDIAGNNLVRLTRPGKDSAPCWSR